MSDEALAARITRVIVKATRIDPRRITPDSTFADLGFDSLDALNIVFMLEDEFHITISDEETRDITSVRHIMERLGPLVAESAVATSDA